MDTINFYGVKKQRNIVSPPEDSDDDRIEESDIDDDDMNQVHQQDYFQSNFIYIDILLLFYIMSYVKNMINMLFIQYFYYKI